MELVCGGWCCGGQWWGVEGSVQASLLPDTVLLVRVFVETLRFLLINGHRVFTCRACVGGVQTSLMYSLITNITPRRIVTEITTLTARTDIVALFELHEKGYEDDVISHANVVYPTFCLIFYSICW